MHNAAIHCDELSAPVNGAKAGNDTSVGARIFFACYRCHELKGASNLTCLHDGQWDGQQPTCDC